MKRTTPVFLDAKSLSNLEGRALVRLDLNVPLELDANGHYQVRDDNRIRESVPLIKQLLERGIKKIVLMSHLGRPDGMPNAKFSLAPVGQKLAQLLSEEIILAEDCVDCEIEALLNLPKTRIVLLENLRFHPEEEANDLEFARKLSQYGDFFINDAFGTAHRKHASTYSVAKFFPIHKTFAGPLFHKEVSALDKLLHQVKRPFVLVAGGAKVKDKIKLLEKFLPQVDTLCIGGAMCYPFLKVQGFEIGKSLCSSQDEMLAREILKSDRAKKIVLPVDHVIADNPDVAPTITSSPFIPVDAMGLDIGPQTRLLFNEKIRSAKTIFWNGPMGLFENKLFSEGTFSLAKTLSELPNTYTVVGGGDSVAAINQSGMASAISHISTGGGASLEYLEQGTLPGLFALKYGVQE